MDGPRARSAGKGSSRRPERRALPWPERRQEHAMSRTDLPRIAVLGAGPVGVEAALYAATVGLPDSVFERGRVGEHLRRWGHVRLFSPFGMNSTPLGRARLRAD